MNELLQLKAQAFEVRAQIDYLNQVYQQLVIQIRDLEQTEKEQTEVSSPTKKSGK